MIKFSTAAATAALMLASVAAQGARAADIIPYPNIGDYNATTYSFVATTTGDITAYFAGAWAGYDNEIGLMIDGAAPTVYGLDDHTSSVGDSLVLGYADAGDSLVLVLNTNGNLVYSDPALNGAYDSGPATGTTDGHNHIYSTPYTATSPIFPGIPVGTYVAFEDLSFPGSDYDYNDETFVLTNVTAVPEPATWAVMLAGFAGLGVALRSRRGRVAAAA